MCECACVYVECIYIYSHGHPNYYVCVIPQSMIYKDATFSWKADSVWAWEVSGLIFLSFTDFARLAVGSKGACSV
jgi:hypothetical protein